MEPNDSNNTDTNFEEWGIIELFGHQQIAGKITHRQIGDASFIQVDVPKTENYPAFSKIYSPKAVYAITPTDQETAKVFVQRIGEQPIRRSSIVDLVIQHENDILSAVEARKKRNAAVLNQVPEMESGEDDECPW